MQDCNLHTVLRLPRGTFTPYSQGVKANVIFFQKGAPTEATWIFDARSNVPGITKKDRPLTPQHFAEFEKAYGADPNGRSKRSEAERFRRFSLSDIKARESKLDITWLKDESLKTATNCLNPKTSPAKQSLNWKPLSMISARLLHSSRRRKQYRDNLPAID